MNNLSLKFLGENVPLAGYLGPLYTNYYSLFIWNSILGIFFFGTSFILCTKSGNPTVIYYQNLIWSQVCTYTGFPSGSAIKNLTATKKTQETWVQSLDWKDPLEEGMATFSSIRAWRIPRTEEPGRLQSMGSQESNTTEVTEHPCIHRHIHMFTHTNTHTHT